MFCQVNWFIIKIINLNNINGFDFNINSSGFILFVLEIKQLFAIGQHYGKRYASLIQVCSRYITFHTLLNNGFRHV
jgi:hypothetical protein